MRRPLDWTGRATNMFTEPCWVCCTCSPLVECLWPGPSVVVFKGNRGNVWDAPWLDGPRDLHAHRTVPGSLHKFVTGLVFVDMPLTIGIYSRADLWIRVAVVLCDFAWIIDYDEGTHRYRFARVRDAVGHGGHRGISCCSQKNLCWDTREVQAGVGSNPAFWPFNNFVPYGP